MTSSLAWIITIASGLVSVLLPLPSSHHCVPVEGSWVVAHMFPGQASSGFVSQNAAPSSRSDPSPYKLQRLSGKSPSSLSGSGGSTGVAPSRHCISLRSVHPKDVIFQQTCYIKSSQSWAYQGEHQKLRAASIKLCMR